jgi:TolB protein
MNREQRIQNTEHRTPSTEHRYRFTLVLFLLVCALGFAPWGPKSAEAKIYIDITSPGIRQLPVSIHASRTPTSREIESIIKSDLEFTGFFSFVDPDTRGAELIARIDVDVSGGLTVILSVNDLIENREVLKKRYSAASIRPLAHSIADDIYYVATGKNGIFRTKLSYLVSTSAGRKELRLMDWDGQTSVSIVSKGLTSSHSWTQDRRYLLYSSENDGKWKIHIMDLMKYKEMVLFSSAGLNLVGGTSPDGLISFSSSKDGSSEIYVIDIYGKGFKKLTSALGIDVSPAFSPDGSRIAFVSDRGGTPQIYIMDSNGMGIKRLTFEGSYNTSPAWSPDGKWISYVGRNNGKNQIFMVKSDASDIRQLTFSGNNENPSFSPDGLFLAYDSDRDGKKGVYIMRLHIGGDKRITPGDINASSPKWSPYLK